MIFAKLSNYSSTTECLLKIGGTANNGFQIRPVTGTEEIKLSTNKHFHFLPVQALAQITDSFHNYLPHF
jgi:hypothetical protein